MTAPAFTPTLSQTLAALDAFVESWHDTPIVPEVISSIGRGDGRTVELTITDLTEALSRLRHLTTALAAADARADMLDTDLAAALDVIAASIRTDDPADDEELIAAYEEHFGARLLRTVVTARSAS